MCCPPRCQVSGGRPMVNADLTVKASFGVLLLCTGVSHPLRHHGAFFGGVVSGALMFLA
jgi:hypothetical protein